MRVMPCLTLLTPHATHPGVPLLGVVPESPDVLKSTNVGRPVILQVRLRVRVRGQG